MSEPIDVVLVAAREQIRRLRANPRDKSVTELVDATEKLADYIGQPDMEKVALHHALQSTGARPSEPDPFSPTNHRDPRDDEGEALRLTFSMQAVVDRIRELAPDVVAYVEMTGGWVATIYAAARSHETGDPRLYRLPGEDWGRWPVMGGPGSFDRYGSDHVASLDEFYISPDVDLVPSQPGPPYGPLPGEYVATRDDDVDSLARAVIEAVRQWEDDEIPHEVGATIWPGR